MLTQRLHDGLGLGAGPRLQGVALFEPSQQVALLAVVPAEGQPLAVPPYLGVETVLGVAGSGRGQLDHLLQLLRSQNHDLERRR